MAFRDREARNAYERRYYKANRRRIIKRNRKYNDAHRTKINKRSKEYYREHLDEKRAYGRNRDRSIKIEVLTKYGPGGNTLQCCWEGCNIVDPDMLTLDHVNNDGAKDRNKVSGHGCGKAMYAKVRRNNFPKGFQTLCANHQLKKECERRRAHLNATLPGVGERPARNV